MEYSWRTGGRAGGWSEGGGIGWGGGRVAAGRAVPRSTARLLLGLQSEVVARSLHGLEPLAEDPGALRLVDPRALLQPEQLIMRLRNRREYSSTPTSNRQPFRPPSTSTPVPPPPAGAADHAPAARAARDTRHVSDDHATRYVPLDMAHAMQPAPSRARHVAGTVRNARVIRRDPRTTQRLLARVLASRRQRGVRVQRYGDGVHKGGGCVGVLDGTMRRQSHGVERGQGGDSRGSASRRDCAAAAFSLRAPASAACRSPLSRANAASICAHAL